MFCGVCLFFVDGLRTGRFAGDLAAIASGVCYAGVFMMNAAEGADPLWVAWFYGETISRLAMLGAVIVVGSIILYNIANIRKSTA